MLAAPKPPNLATRALSGFMTWLEYGSWTLPDPDAPEPGNPTMTGQLIAIRRRSVAGWRWFIRWTNHDGTTAIQEYRSDWLGGGAFVPGPRRLGFRRWRRVKWGIQLDLSGSEGGAIDRICEHYRVTNGLRRACRSTLWPAVWA